MNTDFYPNKILPVLDYISLHYNGETLGEFQIRFKLEYACKLIVYSKKHIADIALEVGYSDLQAFGKNF